jgi:anthranilate/para-aminobenzoate synthase component I
MAEKAGDAGLPPPGVATNMDPGSDFPARRLPWITEPPAELFARVEGLPGAVFLDSAVAGDEAISVIGFAPERIVQAAIGGLGVVREWLERRQDQRKPSGETLPLEGGAAIGFVTYEGEAEFGLYPGLLVFRHRTGEWHDTGGLADHLGGLSRQQCPALDGSELRLEPEIPAEEYIRRVRKAQEYIAAGDIYQVNIAQRYSLPWSPGVSGYELYRELREVSPAPYAAFLRFRGRQILSSSPELFLEIRGRSVSTRPIKGTRPRDTDPARDEGFAAELVSSPKEIAELVMITDLERNDLGQICEFGSVKVTDLARLERFEHVFHLVSTVRGTLREEIDHLTALEACFPGGSITGAPKRRAMEIIAELERGPRGPYTGAIGYFGVDGGTQFSIAIRTAVIEGDRLEYLLGAGIVADSDPVAEYEETLHKGKGLRKALHTWQKRQDFFAMAGEASQVTFPHAFPAPVLRVP